MEEVKNFHVGGEVGVKVLTNFLSDKLSVN